MSYCRVTSPGSDVYIFGGENDTLHCLIADAIAQTLDIRSDFCADGPITKRNKLMLGHLTYLEDQGVRVPGHAKRRLLHEIVTNEEAYEKRETEDDEEEAVSGS